MKITSIRVVNVRSHNDVSLSFSPTTTLISGPNGSGKTSILEAIYISLRGSSFKATDSEVLQSDQEWYRIAVDDDAHQSRVITFDSRGDKKQKQFTVDEKTNKVLLARYRYPIVLFQPDDTRLINGSPARRRKYLDQVVAQYNPQYGSILRRYERALIQRNRLLKRTDVTPDQLFAWDVMLSNLGASIIAGRQQYIDEVNKRIEQYYQKISKDSAAVSVQYEAYGESSAQTLLDKLHRATERDMQLGSTSIGPHRHDFIISLAGKSADATASRGEVRTIILALKYIEVDILLARTGEHPIILLDDVFGELDTARQKQLLTNLTDSQVIITSTEAHIADKHIKL